MGSDCCITCSDQSCLEDRMESWRRGCYLGCESSHRRFGEDADVQGLIVALGTVFAGLGGWGGVV